MPDHYNRDARDFASAISLAAHSRTWSDTARRGDGVACPKRLNRVGDNHLRGDGIYLPERVFKAGFGENIKLLESAPSLSARRRI